MIRIIDDHLDLPDPETSEADSCDCNCSAADGDDESIESVRTTTSVVVHYDVTKGSPGE